MKRYFKQGFLIATMFFVTVSYTGAYFSDSVAVSGNTFTAGVWADPVINEFYSNPATGEIEWIELLNKQPSVLSLSGYTIEDGTGSQKNLNTYSIPANGYLILAKGIDFSFTLNNAGDIIILRKYGISNDQVTYGNWNDGNIVDNAPAPALGQSAARIPDGTDTSVDSADFQIRSGVGITPGGPNV